MNVANDAEIELLHLVARAAQGARPLRSRAACADLWSRLGSRFEVIACALMPDHVHLLARVARERALRTFSQILSSFRARAAREPSHDCADFEWEPLPLPEKVRADPRHLARTIRYIHLNPCRDALCDDPLEWEWSTHRDWTGAVVRGCVDVRRWSRVIGRPPATSAAWMHDYVCSDASVRRHRPLADPRPYLGHHSADASLAMIAASVAGVMRSASLLPVEFALAERRLYLLSAARWTKYRAPEIARSIGCHPTSVRRVLHAAGPDHRFDEVARKSAMSGQSRRSMLAPRLDAPGKEPAARGVPAMNRDELRAMALTLADGRLRWEMYSS